MSPRLVNQMTTRMLKILHASANILMIPEVNRFSTVSTSPTNLDTRAPGSWRFSSLADRSPNFSIRLLRSACVIFWPNTVRRLSLADSRRPVRARSPKYSRIPSIQRVCLFVKRSISCASTRGGSSVKTTAPQTIPKSAADKTPCFRTVSLITCNTDSFFCIKSCLPSSDCCRALRKAELLQGVPHVCRLSHGAHPSR